ncbi:MAG: MotA/TolQ/ExbB proton channel family protein [candidate division WOR-3 bacterium]|uniref:MotA/TolQ/ExbB proton channel domain-containing protein n=2 Tax=candidate division WOR-3 bacterium TaxID=2052148 RepID=A0A7C1NLW6_UNCW3|nr:MotA/TolQ/ExbB proton channel family protein [candidate division WOR-3 bacterium]
MAGQSFFAPFLNAGLFALIILIILFLMSIISWAIFFRKIRQFRRARSQTRALLENFNIRRELTNLSELSKLFPASPLVPLLTAAIEEWQVLKNEFFNHNREDNLNLLVPNITEAMERAASRTLEQLESSLPFLAITTMVAPFLGLLGTVQGVLRTFLSLRGAQLPTLQLIAPGISDALVTTVMGLLVAIPAALFYNYFVGQARNLEGEMDRFISELTGIFRLEACRVSSLENQDTDAK